MRRYAILLGAAMASAAACTIDPVARAELAGAANGAAIFQRAGTSRQMSFQVTLDGVDGTYDLSIDDGTCEGEATPWAFMGTVQVAGGRGIFRGVRDDWDIGSGENDVVGRLLVARRALNIESCGLIFNSD